ncbi:MAG TPA: hypothetical protein DCY75_02375, partial [Clostridiales bacterium]|nr:hypothetical protein [Clostridiales bacterium]
FIKDAAFRDAMGAIFDKKGADVTAEDLAQIKSLSIVGNMLYYELFGDDNNDIDDKTPDGSDPDGSDPDGSDPDGSEPDGS